MRFALLEHTTEQQVRVAAHKPLHRALPKPIPLLAVDPILHGPRSLASRRRAGAGERKQADGHPLQVWPLGHVDPGPFVWSHGLRPRGESDLFVEVVQASAKSLLKIRVVAQDVGVGMLSGRHLLQHRLHLFLLLSRKLATGELGVEAEGSGHGGHVHVLPAGHKELVDLVANLVGVEAGDRGLEVDVELKEVAVHLPWRASRPSCRRSAGASAAPAP
eukprot:scaffold8501_cov129-Isochrysis_galbana.AAC.3